MLVSRINGDLLCIFLVWAAQIFFLVLYYSSGFTYYISCYYIVFPIVLWFVSCLCLFLISRVKCYFSSVIVGCVCDILFNSL